MDRRCQSHYYAPSGITEASEMSLHRLQEWAGLGRRMRYLSNVDGMSTIIRRAVQKDSRVQRCLGPFDHELKVSKLSHAVLEGRRETATKTGEMKSSQRNVRL